MFYNYQGVMKKDEQQQKDVSILNELFDGFSYKILLSVADESKTVFQICKDNSVPISSTYKKIRKLKDANLLCIDKIIINEKGKKVVFYKSKIQSVELTLDKQQLNIQFKK
ncbi:MAG TPA: hypothetical protein VN703_02005 [Candidatus Sulfopaludibacter sp.]|jgi:hypothetical protein|nr:hypothetical protein [Candidatus Sulfopaludibacter sp.]